MFDIGWTELLLIGVVALIVVGPKDLPGMFRTLGRFTAKMRSMAREFQRTLEQAADETGVKEVSRDLRQATSVRNLGLDSIQESAKRFKGGWKSGLEIVNTDNPKPEGAPETAAGTGAIDAADSGDEAQSNSIPVDEESADLAESAAEPEAPANRPEDKPENADPVKTKVAASSEATE